jgi:hypothetical protein
MEFNMTQNNMPHSGREPHFRKIRREVIHRAWQRGWKKWGYSVCKTIRGKRIILTVPKDLGEHYLCRFQLEHDSRFEKRGSYGGLPIPYFMMQGVRRFIDFPPERKVVKERPQKSLDEPKQSAKALYLGRPYQP